MKWREGHSRDCWSTGTFLNHKLSAAVIAEDVVLCYSANNKARFESRVLRTVDTGKRLAQAWLYWETYR